MRWRTNLHLVLELAPALFPPKLNNPNCGKFGSKWSLKYSIAMVDKSMSSSVILYGRPKSCLVRMELITLYTSSKICRCKNHFQYKFGVRERISGEILTVPGKKQQCLCSMYLPNVICNNVKRIQHVSTISHSFDSGCDRRADSLFDDNDDVHVKW